MQKYVDYLIASFDGKPIAGALVLVNVSGGGAAAIYAYDGVTPQANPITTEADGSFYFFAANGLYDLVITKSGLTFDSDDTAKITLFDHAQASHSQAQVTATGSTTARSLEDRFADVAYVRDHGAIGNGVFNSTGAFVAAAAASRIIYITGGPSANYIVTLSSIPLTKNYIWISDGAQVNGVTVIPYMLGVVRPASGNTLRLGHDTAAVPGINNPAWIYRTVSSDEGAVNPKALRVLTDVNVDTAQTEWAISGELNNYSNTESTGNVSVSGTSNKYGLAPVFAGHFNAIDNHSYDLATDTTGVIGVELHARGLGPDEPTLNNGVGLRITADLRAKTSPNATPTWASWAATTVYAQYAIKKPTATTLTVGYPGFYYVATTAGTSGASEPTWPTTVGATVVDGSVTWTTYKGGENGTGIRIKNDDSTSNGWYRVGLSISDDLSGANPNAIQTPIEIRTGGPYGIRMGTGGSKFRTIADISLETDSSYGLSATGNYTNAAIRLGDDQFLALRSSGTVKHRYNTSTSRAEWAVSGTIRAEIELDATPKILLNGVQVVAERDVGWTAMTGTANEGTSYATSTVTLAELAGRVMALQAALTAHGLIGP
jgi:hypothetical protein